MAYGTDSKVDWIYLFFSESKDPIEKQEPKRASDVFAAPTSVTIQQPLQNIQVYTGPVNKEYITKEARRKSFKDWPVTVQVNPEKLADAGFFYLSEYLPVWSYSLNWISTINVKPVLLKVIVVKQRMYLIRECWLANNVL